MCEKAEDLQSSWTPQVFDVVRGDFIGFIKEGVSDFSIIRFFKDKETFGKYSWYSKNELIWLPRLDQLIEMLDEYYFFIRKISTCEGAMWAITCNKNIFTATSVKKAMLKLLMKEKHNKEWNDEKEVWE